MYTFPAVIGAVRACGIPSKEGRKANKITTIQFIFINIVKGTPSHPMCDSFGLHSMYEE